jgi:hypothetical protein
MHFKYVVLALFADVHGPLLTKTVSARDISVSLIPTITSLHLSVFSLFVDTKGLLHVKYGI